MISPATNSYCPICFQNQPKGVMFSGLEKLREVIGSRTYKHLQTHASEVRKAIEAEYTLTETVMIKAINAVLKQIEKHGKNLSSTTIEIGMLVMLRHNLGSDKMKDDHALKLGGTNGMKLKNILSEDDYKEYSKTWNKLAGVILRHLRKIPVSSQHQKKKSAVKKGRRMPWGFQK